MLNRQPVYTCDVCGSNQHPTEAHSKEVSETPHHQLKKVAEGVWSSSSLLMWSPEGVAIYNNLQSDAEYHENITEKEIAFLESRSKDLLYFLPEEFTVIDLGPGDGRKSARLIGELSGEATLKYFGIDASPEMIGLAKNTFADNQLPGEFYNQDFVTALEAIRDKVDGTCLITSLGLTPFSDTERNLVLFNRIKPIDRAFITFEPRERLDIEQEKQIYGSQRAMGFHHATLKQLGLEYGVHVDDLEVSDEIGVYVTVKEVTPALAENGINLGDKIRIGLSYRPSIPELAANFENSGMMANLLDDGGKFAGLLLVPKQETGKIEIDPPKLEDTHPFKKHFEGENGKKAYNRMVAGSLELLPYLETFIKGKKIMEVGPFYDPLTTEDRFPDFEITYVDRDKSALEFLKRETNSARYFEFGVSDPAILQDIPEQDAIITSHIVNHIGLPDLVQILGSKLKADGVLFMNESIDYGGDSMHEDRPRSIEAIMDYLRNNGFKVISYRIIPSPNTEFQPNSRVVLAAQKH